MEAYESPSVEIVGEVHDLTQAASSGMYTDAAFPAGTPRGDLTFS